ncbi:MAG: hypothetical protein GX275_00945 [Clostridiales bacterium]|nr:hypothetical protein [Clostridiales bacterium]
MNTNTLDLLMYLDEGLVRNLSSLVLSGYIDIRTTRLIRDKTLSGRAAIENREHNFDEDRCAEDEREGYKGTNLFRAEHSEETINNMANIENREFIRREEEIKKIYTTFTLHKELFNGLNTIKPVKIFDNVSIKDGDISSGDYVKISGELISESVNSYLDSLINIFSCFGCDCLNKIITTNDSSMMNFTSINNIVNHLNEILNRNSTQDLILNCGDTPIVLNVNNNFFMNNNSYVYDKIDCPCTVFGKVIKVAKNGQSISLLRKTAQHDYYENLLGKCTPYCDKLTNSGIVVPKMPRLKCEGISLIIIPISICM